MSFIPEGQQRIIALSHSRIETHIDCPRKAKYKFIMRMKEPGSIAMDRGSEIHQQLDDYISRRIDEVPVLKKAPKVEAFVNVLRNIPECMTEKQYAFDQNWQLVEWFSPDVYFRVVYDVVLYEPEQKTVLLVDHKTGKYYAKHQDQMREYAFCAFCIWPDVEEVSVRFLYLDLDKVQHGHCEPFRRDKDFDTLKGCVEARCARVRNDTVFPTRPGPKCNWCHFRRSNGGPCDHG